jgi:hypothetical protein
VFSPEGKTFFSKDMQSAADEWLGPKDERTYICLSSSLKKFESQVCMCSTWSLEGFHKTNHQL